jgi:hypothetical protein
VDKEDEKDEDYEEDGVDGDDGDDDEEEDGDDGDDGDYGDYDAIDDDDYDYDDDFDKEEEEDFDEQEMHAQLNKKQQEQHQQQPLDNVDVYSLAHEVNYNNSVAEVFFSLKKFGFYSYCERGTGKAHHAKETADRICKRVAEFLCWSFCDTNTRANYLQGNNSMDYFKTVLVKQFNEIFRYGLHLHENQLLTPSTVKNYVVDITNAAKWRALQFRESSHYTPPLNISSFQMSADLLNK